jgi:hypothetical protein
MAVEPGNAAIDLGPHAGTIARVVVEPYRIFLAKLYAAGRITDAEVTTLRTVSEDRIARLSEFVCHAVRGAQIGETVK